MNDIAQQELEAIERQINAEAFEAFYSIGQKLLDIKFHRRYEAAGFKSWAAYCASGRIDYRRAQADNYIRAAELRPKIATNGSSNELWSERLMRELCKCETDVDAKRVATKAADIAERSGVKLTAKLVAQVRDASDETGNADERRDAELAAASITTHYEKLADMLVGWRYSLEQLDYAQRRDVPNEYLIRIRTELQKLVELFSDAQDTTSDAGNSDA